MKNIAIENMLNSNKMLAPRLRTDKLFVLPAGCLDFRGYLDDTVRLIEEIQLSDRPLWSRFVQVFTERPDGENRGWRGEYWGKMMRGGCITYQYTQSPRLLESLSAAVRALLPTADEDGRISSYPRDLEYKGERWSVIAADPYKDWNGVILDIRRHKGNTGTDDGTVPTPAVTPAQPQEVGE